VVVVVVMVVVPVVVLSNSNIAERKGKQGQAKKMKKDNSPFLDHDVYLI